MAQIDKIRLKLITECDNAVKIALWRTVYGKVAMLYLE
jgi:hypothetical protein